MRSTTFVAAAVAVACIATAVTVAAGVQAAALPPPQFARSVDIGLISGTVIVRPAHGRSFRLTPQDQNIPVGSSLDTTHGAVDLRTAPAPGAAGSAGIATVQDGHFSGGLFRVLQRPDQHGLAVIVLQTRLSRRRACSLASPATAHVGARVLALLHATVHGMFRTSGRFSSATARGTQWETEDRCDGTLTHVRRGVVDVLDFALRRTIVLHAGQSYLARAP